MFLYETSKSHKLMIIKSKGRLKDKAGPLLGFIKKLHGLCRNPSNLEFTVRLIQQSFSLPKYPEKLYFFDASIKQMGQSSFVNRSKQISELISPFAWLDLNVGTFKAKIKATVYVIAPVIFIFLFIHHFITFIDFFMNTFRAQDK